MDRPRSAGVDLSPSTGVLLRSDPAEFTVEELEALAGLDLPDPDPEEVRKTLGIQSIAAKTEDRVTIDTGETEEPANGREQDSNEAQELDADSEKERVSPSSSPLSAGKQHHDALETDSSLFVTFPRPPKQYPKKPVNPETFFADFLLPSRPSSATDEQSAARNLRLKDFNVRHRAADSSQELSTSAPVSRAGRLGISISERLGQSSLVGHSSTDHMNLALGILPRVNRQGDTDAIAEAVLQTHHVEFIDYGLTDTLPAEMFLNATHVFLQHNQITELDGLQLLFNLQVLVVHHNRIRTLQPLGVFTHLTYLDASYNEIQHINVGWDLPDTLNVLDLRHNPCCPTTSKSATLDEVQQHRQRAIAHCTKLTELDGKATDGSSDSDDEEEEEEEKEKEMAHPLKNDEKTLNKSSEKNPPPLSTNLVNSSSHVVTGEKNNDDYDDDDDGLVSTPTREEGGRRSPGVSRGLHKRLVPAGLRAPRDPSPGIGSQFVKGKRPPSETKQSKKGTSAPSNSTVKQPDQALDGKTKRRSVVEEARAARGVKFDLPPEPVQEATPKGRRPSDAHVPYPKYDTGLLRSNPSRKANQNDDWDTEGLTAPVDAMLSQYSRRINSFMNVLRDEANVVEVAPTGEVPPNNTRERAPWGAPGAEDDDLPEELRQARQVRNRARSDLEYASKVLGHRSRRAIEGLWADVNKVIQTRHQLVSERQRRIEKLTKEHSSAYLESLSLLKKEQHTTDLEKYRNPPEKSNVESGENATESEGNA